MVGLKFMYRREGQDHLASKLADAYVGDAVLWALERRGLVDVAGNLVCNKEKNVISMSGGVSVSASGPFAIWEREYPSQNANTTLIAYLEEVIIEKERSSSNFKLDPFFLNRDYHFYRESALIAKSLDCYAKIEGIVFEGEDAELRVMFMHHYEVLLSEEFKHQIQNKISNRCRLYKALDSPGTAKLELTDLLKSTRRLGLAAKIPKLHNPYGRNRLLELEEDLKECAELLVTQSFKGNYRL